MIEYNKFLSTKLLSNLFKELRKINKSRHAELQVLGDVFGDPFELSKNYIEPKCQHHNPSDYDENDPISYISSPVFITLNNFFNKDFLIKGDGRSQMFILSDAGMGKTSLLLMIKLSHITSFWPKNYNCILLKINKNTINDILSINNKCNTILLLDALDEDDCYYEDIKDRINDLLINTINFKRVVISCRTQFFPDDCINSFGLPGKITLGPFSCPVFYLSYFDDFQVEEYLRKKFSVTIIDKLLKLNISEEHKAKKILYKIGSLQYRPLLLSHIEDLVDSYQNIYNDYLIFEILLKKWLMREEIKIFKLGRKSTAIDLLNYCILIAQVMQLNNSRVINIDEIINDEYYSNLLKKISDINYIDFKGRSLLNTTSDGKFRFSHYSIQEFLIAYSICTEGLLIDPSKLKITDQIYNFIFHYLVSNFDYGKCDITCSFDDDVKLIIYLLLLESEDNKNIKIGIYSLIKILLLHFNDNFYVDKEFKNKIFLEDIENKIRFLPYSYSNGRSKIDFDIKEILRYAIDNSVKNGFKKVGIGDLIYIAKKNFHSDAFCNDSW